MTSKVNFPDWLKLKNYRLRYKLIITYILLTAVPLSLIGYISYSQYTKSIEEQSGEYVARLLDQINENIDRQIVELEHLPELLNNSAQVMSILRKDSYPNQSEILNDRFVVNGYLSKTYFSEKQNTRLLGVFVWSNNGLFSSTKVPYGGFDSEPNLRGEKKIILPGDTDLRFRDSPDFILICEPIHDVENRRILGEIYIAVDLSFIDHALLDLEQQNQADMWIMNPTGRIIYHINRDRMGDTLSIDDYPLLNGSFKTHVNGERKLVSVSQSMQRDWILVHSISSKVLTQKTDRVMDVIQILFVVIVILTSLISIIVAWSVSNPIHKLAQIMRGVEKGNFQVDLEINSKDEIGILAGRFNSMIHTIRELIQQNYDIELRQKQAELYALQSQINPHFMYNTLETINMAVEEEDKETVVKMVNLLSKMMRFSLSNKNRIVTILNEVEHITNYLSIQKFRFEHRLEFDFQTDIELSHYYSPKFVLQPIIENCIKHGLESRKKLIIRIIVTKERLHEAESEDIVIKIIDNGQGINQVTLAQIQRLLLSDPIAKRDSGFGLINVHARISMLFGARYGLTVQSELDKGTQFTIRIPVIHDLLTVRKYDRAED